DGTQNGAPMLCSPARRYLSPLICGNLRNLWMGNMSDKAQLVVDGKKLTVSNLNKVLYPKVGFTKGQIIDYYIRIAPVLLPHVHDRPLTMKRYPNGVDK